MFNIKKRFRNIFCFDIPLILKEFFNSHVWLILLNQLSHSTEIRFEKRWYLFFLFLLHVLKRPSQIFQKFVTLLYKLPQHFAFLLEDNSLLRVVRKVDQKSIPRMMRLEILLVKFFKSKFLPLGIASLFPLNKLLEEVDHRMIISYWRYLFSDPFYLIQ